MERIMAVAFHESNHSFVAKGAGGIVHKETVVPEGRTLGYVLTSFKNLPFKDALEGMMASCVAGYIAEEKIGHSDHSGCSSDLAQLNYLATIAARHLGEGKLSAEHFKAKAYAKARALTPSLDILTTHAELLAKVGTIV